MKNIFILFVFITSINFAQQWVNVNPHLSNYPVKIIHMLDSNTGFIITDREVWKTKDGKNFYQVFSNNDSQLTGIFVFGNHVIVTGYYRIIYSADTGETFNVNTYTFGMKNFRFVDENYGWALTFDNKIVRTTDRGVNWSFIQPPVNPFDIYFSDHSNGFMTTDAGVNVFYKTTNGGITWISVYAGLLLNNANITFFNSSIGYINNYTNFMFTSDGGNTWTQRTTKRVSFARREIGFSYDEGAGYPVVHYTTDFGATWKKLPIPQMYSPVFEVLGPAEFLFGTSRGSIYKTTNAGLNWKPVTPPAFSLYNGFFLDDNHGWLYHNHIMRTTNGGNTWTAHLFKDQFESMHFFDKLNGLAVKRDAGNSTYFYWLTKTTDGGETWDSLFKFDHGAKLFFRDRNNGFLVGQPMFYSTTDGGTTWDQTNPHSLTGLKLFFLDSLKWYLTGNYSGLRTLDGGQTWISSSNLRGHDIFVIDTMNIWKAQAHALFRSTDGGQNFETIMDHGQDCSFKDLTFFSINEGYASWPWHHVVMRLYNGNAYSYLGVPYIENMSLRMRSPQLAYVFGEEGAIYKYTTEQVPVELSSFTIEKKDNNVHLLWTTTSEKNNKGFRILRSNAGVEKEIAFINGAGTTLTEKNYTYTDKNPSSGTFTYKLGQEDFDGTVKTLREEKITINEVNKFSLEQNYPNPFNPLTTIKYAIPETGHTTLEIFDILGNKTTTLVNETKSPGSYETEFNASTLPSGIYFYRLTSGKYTMSKKLLLVK